MLTLGVPGSGTTAVMLGALMLYNIQPGPQLFAERPELVGGLIASLYIGNVLLLILSIPFVGIFSRVLMLPNWILVPGILALSVVGVYSTHASVASILLMLGIGVLGWGLRKLSFNMAPLILGFVLVKVMEVNLRNALAISGGDPSILFQSWISLTLWALAVLVAVGPWLLYRWTLRRSAILAETR
jgi:putative tricarboxylic transport membrane protein